MCICSIILGSLLGLNSEECSLLGVFVNMIWISCVCKHDYVYLLFFIFPRLNNAATSNDQNNATSQWSLIRTSYHLHLLPLILNLYIISNWIYQNTHTNTHPKFDIFTSWFYFYNYWFTICKNTFTILALYLLYGTRIILATEVNLTKEVTFFLVRLHNYCLKTQKCSLLLNLLFW